MSNTAKQFQPLDSTSVEGLDSLFNTEAQTGPEQAQVDPTIEAQAAPEQAQVDPVIETQTDPEENGIPLDEAAKLLDLHIDTVRKRLQKGKLQGYKSNDKYGKKWFVCASELEDLLTTPETDPEQAQVDPAIEAQTDPEQAKVDPIIEAQTDPPQAKVDPIIEAQTDPPQAQDSPAVEIHSIPIDFVDVLKSKDSVIENQAHQLKAAGDVIMYMRSQLEEKDQQLKLLTDSQHQPNRWQRVWKWFIGG